jgi:nitrogen regulatory protein PII
MKMIVALIRPERLTSVKRALRQVDAEQITVRRRNPHPDARVYMAPKLRVEIIVTERNAENVFHIVRQAAIPEGTKTLSNARVFMVAFESQTEPNENETEESADLCAVGASAD